MPSVQKTDIALSETEARRLAWRCRRGLLELDIVLQRFVAASFKTLTSQELFALDALLELPDNDFWGLLSTENAPSLDLDTLNVIHKIKSMHQER
jgi:antitoxin CptB